MIFKLIGALGLILMTIGVVYKKRKIQDYLYIIGGICLLSYSIYIHALIFIILQIVFTLAAFYDLVVKTNKHEKKKKK